MNQRVMLISDFVNLAKIKISISLKPRLSQKGDINKVDRNGSVYFTGSWIFSGTDTSFRHLYPHNERANFLSA